MLENRNNIFEHPWGPQGHHFSFIALKETKPEDNVYDYDMLEKHRKTQTTQTTSKEHLVPNQTWFEV